MIGLLSVCIILLRRELCVAKFFLDQSIGIDKTNTFQLKFLMNWNTLIAKQTCAAYKATESKSEIQMLCLL